MPLNNKLKPEKDKKFKVEKLPEKTRKKILTIAIVILMIVIISFWMISLKISLIYPAGQQEKNLNGLAGDAKEIFNKLKNQLGQSAPAETDQTTTIELSEDNIKKIKDKLLEQPLD